MNPVKSPSSPPHCRSVEWHAGMSNTTFPLDALELYSCFDAGGKKHTFALHDVGGAVEVCGCVSWTGDAVVLAKLPLKGASRTADAAVCAGVVVMSWRTLHCRGQTQRHALVNTMLPKIHWGFKCMSQAHQWVLCRKKILFNASLCCFCTFEWQGWTGVVL